MTSPEAQSIDAPDLPPEQEMTLAPEIGIHRLGVEDLPGEEEASEEESSEEEPADEASEEDNDSKE